MMEVIKEFFETIKREVNNGGDINKTDSGGRTRLTQLLDKYYHETWSDENVPICKRYCMEKGVEPIAFDEQYVEDYQRKSLNERGLLDILEWFFDHGADPNGDVLIWDDYGCETDSSLMLAVVNLDYYLARYLLKHGADPNKRICYDNTDYYPVDSPDPFLIEDIDIQLWDALGEKRELCGRMARLLIDHGQKHHGLMCMTIDENGVIIAHGPRLRY